MMVVETIALNDSSMLGVDDTEVLRYLGVRSFDKGTIKIIRECEVELYKLAFPKAVYSLVDISVKENTVDFGFMKVQSKKLSKNLERCNCAYVFCATLGISPDRYFERLLKISPAKATVFSACASALIERFCDYINEKIVSGARSCPRFSCGYGDFCIEHQGEILEALQAKKELGVGLTDAYMMVPVKTVTAIIGIRR